MLARKEACLRLGLNLRGDLAKLGDEELVKYFDECLAHREWLVSAVGVLSRWSYRSDLTALIGRGPLHARVFYRLLGFLQFGPRIGVSPADLYITDCELKDVLDELKRRAPIALPQKA